MFPLSRLTVNFKLSKGFHFALLVGGGAHVRPRILVGDARNCQHVGLLETLGGKLIFQLDKDKRHRDTQSMIRDGEGILINEFP